MSGSRWAAAALAIAGLMLLSGAVVGSARSGTNLSMVAPVDPNPPSPDPTNNDPAALAGPKSAPLVGAATASPAHSPAAWSPPHVSASSPRPATSGIPGSGSIGAGLTPSAVGSCVGRVSPAGGAPVGGCSGSDEPSLNPFSDLVGSGGNVSWNVSLPVDRSPTQNQSDLYSAVWFGLNLNDPYGYDGQCLFELQLYPDMGANFTPQPGVWSAFAVGWHLELASGVETRCFVSPVNVTGTSTPIVFGQGDHLNVTMLGWVGSAYGENVSIQDLSTGQSASLNLFNHSLGFPLNPAYSTNNLAHSLPWSPGGNLPISVSFETGHSAIGPTNNPFGGCSPGVPPPTIFSISTPCPSYDPQSWANDTLVPWHFYPTVFFNAQSRQTATQVGFGQNFGGPLGIDPLSQGSCLGSDGSAWCTYPWFSYLGALHAITFGALDYLGTTQDFGQFHQFAPHLAGDSAGFAYFPLTNFTVQGTPGSTLTIALHGAGSVYFLNQVYSGSAPLTSFTVSNLPAGSYSVNAVAAAGSYFGQYAGLGGVGVDAPLSAWSSFKALGKGTLSVTFLTHPHSTLRVAFMDSPNVGRVSVDPGFIAPVVSNFPTLPLVGSGIQVAPTSRTVTNAGALGLVPGIYSFHAYPRPGERFTGWSSSAGIVLFTPAANYTWANVTAAGTVVAHYAPTTAKSTLTLASVPAQGGSITFNGHKYSSGTVVSVPVGAYAVAASPNPTYAFKTWSTGAGATMSNFSRTTVVVLQEGPSALEVLFSSTPMVQIMNIGGGAILLNGVNVSGQLLPLPQVLNQSYAIIAAPYTAKEFVYWNVSPVSNLSVQGKFNAYAHVFSSQANLTVNGSGQLIAFFAPYPPPLTIPAPYHVAFVPTSGTIVFNGILPYTSNGTANRLIPGVYALSYVAPPGKSFVGWTSTPGVTVITHVAADSRGEYVWTYSLQVGANGTVTALFATTVYPVTFVDTPSSTGGIATLTGSAGTFAVPSGSTARLPAGSYSVSLGGAAYSGANWTSTSNLTITGSLIGLTTTLVVAGSGTLFALAVSAPVVHGTANPPITGSNRTTQLTVTVLGGTAMFSYLLSTASLPPGTITCTPALVNSSANTSVSTCVSTATGTFSIDVQVTDALGFVATTSVSVQFS